MSWFDTLRRPTTPWCGSAEFRLTTWEGRQLTFGVLHIFAEHVELWAYNINCGSFSRQELGSFLRLRIYNGPQSESATWQMVGNRVAISLNGIGIHYVPVEKVEWLAAYV